MTETDMLVLIELVQIALPYLDFDDPDQYLTGDELLWLVNYTGAACEYCKEDTNA